MCCPQCVPGSVEPASDVLQRFLSPEQHRDWARHRVVEVEGGTTGHRYLVAHRHSGHARRWGRITWDADDSAVLHYHDNSHPPEEEVLGAMLCLAHREAWVRNEASCLGASFTRVLKNPFGDFMDGTRDAALMQAFGGLAWRAAIDRGVSSPALDAAGAEVAKGWEQGLEELERIWDGRGRPRVGSFF